MIKGLIKLSRIEDYYGSATAVAGISLIANPNLPLIDRGVLLFIILLLNIFCFAINDIEDAEDDAKDPAKVNRNPISAKIISRGVAQIFTWSVAILSLFLLSKFGLFSLVTGAFIVITGFLYSFKPVRLKSVPFLDLISHGLFLGGLQSLVIITANNNPVSSIGIVIAFVIFLSSVLGDINNEIRDYKVDRETGIRNTASVIDLTKIKHFTHYLSVAPYGVIGVVILLNANFLTLVYTIPLFILAGLYYLVAYASKKKRGFYDKHGLKLSALFGLILLATI